jgi:hypothetical protein
VKIRRVLLDRGFYSVKVVKLLRKLRLKYLIPAKETAPVKELARAVAEKETHNKAHNSERIWKRELHALHCMERGEEEVAAVYHKHKGAQQKSGSLAELYRRRWGIETSYRMKNNFKAKSCSKKYAVRYIQFMLCICMYNFWTLLNALYAILQGKILGDPEITLDRFVFYLRIFVFQGAS